MVSAPTAPPSSPSTAATGRRGLLLRVNLWLIGVIVDVVVALQRGDKMPQEKKRGGKVQPDGLLRGAFLLLLCRWQH